MVQGPLTVPPLQRKFHRRECRLEGLSRILADKILASEDIRDIDEVGQNPEHDEEAEKV